MARHYWECADCGEIINFREPELPLEDIRSEQHESRECQNCFGKMYFDVAPVNVPAGSAHHLSMALYHAARELHTCAQRAGSIPPGEYLSKSTLKLTMGDLLVEISKFGTPLIQDESMCASVGFLISISNDTKGQTYYIRTIGGELITWENAQIMHMALS
jgi:hypothetical protein